ncbi:MAG: nitroreductase family protein, partial [Chlorobiales bacterium]|nr:nitroreductase family protein [Chlorobiales bacterium]
MSDSERQALYKVIYSRRDVRGQFLPDPVPEEALRRVLDAAHHAPSVGFMQPWDFIVVRDPELRQKIKEGFEIAHAEASAMFDGDKRDQ